MHVDMDSFFTSIEQREHPELRGKPVVVGALPKRGKGRGVVSTASYEARAYGIRSGMPISKAYRLCPHAKFLPVNFPLYEKVSANIMAILRKNANKFEPCGIDEAFLDISQRVKNFEEAKEIALRIKEEIKQKEQLTCSIGIGPNKTVAKIASAHQKPDGLTVVKPEEVREFLAPKSVREIPGIGPKSEQILAQLGVRTIGELRRIPIEKLTELFGKWGKEMYDRARGIDESEVVEFYETKSIGREHTFERDTDNVPAIVRMLSMLSKRAHAQIKEEKFKFKTIILKIRYEDFETHTHQKTLKERTDELQIIKEVARDLLSYFLPLKKKVRLIGIRVHK